MKVQFYSKFIAIAPFLRVSLIFLLPTWIGCTTVAPSSDIEVITIGYGGGFSGIRTGYRIERSGLIEEWEMLRDSFRVRTTVKMPARSVREYFTRAASLRLDTLNLDEPGNMTSWLEIKTKKATTRLRWNTNHHLPTAVANFYRDLYSFCQEAVKGK